MKVTAIGTGYVGLTLGVCLADLGNDVICVDKDSDKIKLLQTGVVPFYEPSLADLLKRNIRENRINFTTDVKEGITKSEILFIAVGTPADNNNRADLRFVKEVAEDIAKHINGYKVIVNKSTVPVGTAEMVKDIVIKSNIEFDVVSNPEFLREGAAIGDFFNPDRIIIGTNSSRAADIMCELYSGITRTGKPLVITDIKSAELIKYGSNAMLATRISFMNELSRLCEIVGADIKNVARGMGLDGRIGPRFLQAGIGYGGSCFPKDIKALIQTYKDNGISPEILVSVEKINESQIKLFLNKIYTILPTVQDKIIAIWGLAFKPKTDDMREAPSLKVIADLQSKGAIIQAFDPEAQINAKKMTKNIKFCSNPYEALQGAHCLVIITEWNEFRDLDKVRMKNLMCEPNIIDGRNIYDVKEMKDFKYISVGR